MSLLAMSSVTTTRILASVLLFLLTLVAGALPPLLANLWRRRRRQADIETSTTKLTKKRTKAWFTYENVMKMAMFFGGGVLMATCFIHLMPESRENLHHFLEQRQATHSHEAFLSIESHEHHRHEHEQENKSQAQVQSFVHDHDHDDRRHENITVEFLEPIEHHKHEHNHEHEDLNSHHSHDHSHGDEAHTHTHSHGIPIIELYVCIGFFLIFFLEEIVHSFIPHHHEEDDQSLASSVSTNTLEEGVVITDCVPHSNSLEIAMTTDSKFQKPTSLRFMEGLILIIAFSVHSIFDGVAIGIQQEETHIWALFAAICSHKLVVALAVGMELFKKTESVVMTMILMSFFSAMSPIGIFLIMGTESNFSGSESPVMIILTAIATGTILYIVFFEVLQREGKEREPRLFGILLNVCLLAGFAFMFSVTIYIPH